MIRHDQSITIEAGIDDVWGYTGDMQKWGSFMPGCKSFNIVDERHSRWTLKVGVGALVRTVVVAVTIDEWDGPERVAFSFKLDNDPVKGDGSYVAIARSPTSTDLVLTLCVEGSGPMAPIWEAMGRPLLPQLIRSFCQQLKDEIEASVRAKPATSTSPVHAAEGRSWPSLRWLWLKFAGLWKRPAN